MSAPRRSAFGAWLCGALAAALVSLASSVPARADESAPVPADGAAPGAELRISVLTMGPGDHPFFKFGHNAILVEGPGRSLVYNFGTFHFDSPALIPKFLRGRLRYWLSVSTGPETFDSYASANRSIVAQELDLTPAQRLDLKQALEENARPQNREYLYDYFWDNCSTRVRDAVDRAVGGRVREAGRGPASQTFRAHALRMTADLPPEYVGLHLGLGSLTDAAMDEWQEAFLPERLQDLLRRVRLPAEASAPERPLVKAERVLWKANRPDKPARPPSWTLGFAFVGLAAGGVFVLLGRLGRDRRAARVGLGVLGGIVGLVAGLLGLILVALWAFTNHKAAHANENILQFAPFAVALVASIGGVARGRARAVRRAYRLAGAAAVAAGLGVLAKALPGVHQDNTAFIALMLPLWLGLAAGLRLLGQRASAATSAGDSARL